MGAATADDGWTMLFVDPEDGRFSGTDVSAKPLAWRNTPMLACVSIVTFDRSMGSSGR